MKKSFKIALSIISLGALIYFALCIHDEFNYRNYIPAHIGVKRIVKENIDGFREYYGGVIFSLNTKTLERVRTEGIVYLNQDLYSRGDKKNNRAEPTYTAWKKSDCDFDTFAIKTILRGDEDLYKKINSEFAKDNVFCTQKPNTSVTLTVIPNLGILIWTFVD